VIGSHFLVSAHFALVCASYAQAQGCLSLSESHRLFQLREEATKPNASAFCKGVSAVNSQQIELGSKLLASWIQEHPKGPETYRVHEVLALAYFRVGKYRRASAEIASLLKLKPSASDAKAVASLYATLSRYPDQETVHAGRSSVQCNDLMQVPVTINGKSATYFLDTGANLSTISESEATRVGLQFAKTSTKLGDSSGVQVGIQIANANDVQIGKAHFKHVAFAIVSDAQQPFRNMAQSHRGGLGISVLLGMQSMRWNRNGVLEFSIPPPAAQLVDSNLLFDGANPVALVSYNANPLSFTLDTGAVHTDLGPVFAKEFPRIVAKGKKQKQILTGIGGDIVRSSIVVSPLPFLIGGHRVILDPAFILDAESLDSSRWAAGNLGVDLYSGPRNSDQAIS